MIKVFFGTLGAIIKLFSIYPDVVFGKGGYASFPTIFAARILRIPVFIHESDAVPGLSNRTAANWAKKIFISFPETEHFKSSSKTVLVGNPVRKSLLGGDKEKAKELFKLSFEKRVLDQ